MKHVLVAEDDLVIRKLYQIHFQRNGIHGEFFDTGRGMLDAAHSRLPDLVILDIELPDIDGPEVMREFRAIPGCQSIPIIFITGRATPGVSESLRAEGASAVLGKPFSPVQVVHLVRQLTSPPPP